MYSFLVLCCLAEVPKVVEIQPAHISTITQTVRLIGTLKAKRFITFVASVSGILDQLVSAGEKLSKGASIAHLENQELLKTYQLAKEGAKIAKAQYERFITLAKTKASSKQVVEEQQHLWIKSQQDLSAAKIALDQTYFKAPFEGVVGAYKMREGAQVQPGDKIVSFYDPSETIVEFDIPEPLLKKISANQKVLIENQLLKLSHFQKVIDPDTHMAPTFVDFKCKNCIIGANVYVNLIVAEHKDVIVLPCEAVFLKNGKTHVYLVKKNKAVLTPVTLGIQEKDKVEIVKGLKVGEKVIIKGTQRLSPDSDVKIL